MTDEETVLAVTARLVGFYPGQRVRYVGPPVGEINEGTVVLQDSFGDVQVKWGFAPHWESTESPRDLIPL